MIGLDISSHSVKVVRVSDKDRMLLAYARAVIPFGVIEKSVITDAPALQKIITEALARCGLPGGAPTEAVVASIPENQSFLRVIEIPLMAADEITEAMQWEVAQHIPFGLENVYIDWQPLVSGGHVPATGRQEVLVGAAQKKVVDPLVIILKNLHLDVAAMELESQAIVRSLVSPGLRGQQGLLIVDLGGSGTNVVIHDHGTIRFTASLQKGLNDLEQVLPRDLNTSLQETQALRPEDLTRLAGLLVPAEEQLVMEIRGIIEFYNSIDAQHEVREILLTGGGANLPGLDQVFLRHFDSVRIQRGNPWVNVLTGRRSTKPPLDIRESARYTTALGLALRPIII